MAGPAAKMGTMPSAPDRPAATTPGVGEAAGAQIDWRRNLAALWFAEFTAILGFSFVFPFLPVFIRTELHIQTLGQVSLWAGAAGGAAGLGLAIASPLWGVLADRY